MESDHENVKSVAEEGKEKKADTTDADKLFIEGWEFMQTLGEGAYGE